mmetsp:Transcript_10787/g.13525  ORF Transcript_10787/g.13525 Transcript_10787/m.13525 type:complete len:99 (-) Transcript_10787:344-640(-)
MAAARRHNSYEYSKHRLNFILQGAVLMLGLFACTYYSFILLLVHKHQPDTVFLGTTARLAHYIGLSGPCFVSTFIIKPGDLFSVFNAWPEQTSRVSIM